MARVAAPPDNPAAGDEGMPVTTFPLKRAVLFKMANCDVVAARHFFEDFYGVFGFLCYIPALLTNRI
jgi:hypothetical protein